MFKTALKFICVLLVSGFAMVLVGGAIPFLQNTIYGLATYIVPWIIAFLSAKEMRGSKADKKPIRDTSQHDSSTMQTTGARHSQREMYKRTTHVQNESDTALGTDQTESPLTGEINSTATVSAPNTDTSNSLTAFQDAMLAYRRRDSLENHISACDQVLTIIPSVKEREVVRIIRSEGTTYGNFYSHPIYGTYSNGDKYLQLLSDKVELDRKQAIYRLKKATAFRNALESIPQAEVSINSDAPHLHRQSLSNMPEIHYSSITTSTNKSRLPCFVVIDTETNGIKVQGGRILELSAIRYEDFEPVASWSTLINPGQSIPTDATEINHITDEMVANAPTLSQIATSFVDFVGNAPVVGYNLPFDLKFIYSRGIDIVSQKRRYYDVLPLARRIFKSDLDQFRLADVAEHCGIISSDAHRSLADCFTTAQIFEICVDEISSK